VFLRAHPVVGVGSGNCTIAEPCYLLISPHAIKRGDFILDRTLASEQYSKQLWRLLAMGPALLALAQRVPDPPHRGDATVGSIDS
jgi:hypothetical protein